MNWNIYLPQTPYLQTVMQVLWQADGFPENQQETIIPKGVVEIIFDFGETRAIQVQFSDQLHRLPRVFINGFNSAPIQLQHPPGHVFLGVQFHSTVIKSLFGVPAQEFANRAIDMTLIDTIFHTLWHRMAEQVSFKQRVAIMVNWLESKSVKVQAQEKMLQHFLGKPAQVEQSVASLAKSLCYSARHLSRKIHALTDMNTEELLCYKKYLYSIQLMHATELSLTEIAHECNFVDQSHFIKTFKTFAHLTPGEYRQRKSQIPGHFYQDVR